MRRLIATGRITSKGYGSVSVDPRATAPLPTTYDGILAAIARCERFRDHPPADQREPGDFAYNAIRLHTLENVRRAMEREMSELRTEAAWLTAGHPAHENAERFGGA